MRKGRHSDGFPFFIIAALWILSEIGKATFGDLFKTWATKELTRHGYGEAAVSVFSSLAEYVPAIAIAAIVVTGLYIYFRREFERMAAELREPTVSDGPAVNTSVKTARPLPIALSVESLASYMRTSPRVIRLDQTIAKTGRWQMSSDGHTLALGLFPGLKGFGVANVAEVDALLEEKEELILHSATHWIMKDGVRGGQCVWELCKVMSAERGKDPHTKKIVDDYLAAKSATNVTRPA